MARVGETVDELELRLGREGALLRLEPVARAHLDDLDARRPLHSYIVTVWSSRMSSASGGWCAPSRTDRSIPRCSSGSSRTRSAHRQRDSVKAGHSYC